MLKRTYPAVKPADNSMLPQWIRISPPELAFFNVIVTCSAELLVFSIFSGTEARSWAASCSVPHWPCRLLKTSDHWSLPSFFAQRLYSPAGTFTSPNVRGPVVLNVVDLSAPNRQTSPVPNLERRLSTVRPLSEGRPYSTETVVPFNVSLAVPRGLLACASADVAKHTAA